MPRMLKDDGTLAKQSYPPPRDPVISFKDWKKTENSDLVRLAQHDFEEYYAFQGCIRSMPMKNGEMADKKYTICQNIHPDENSGIRALNTA